MPKFDTVLFQGGGNTTGIIIPPEVVEELASGKRPKVVVTLNGTYSYRNTVAVMGGRFMVGVSAEHREKSGLKGGDTISVELTLDTAPRTVEVPAELAAALVGNTAAQAAFERLSYSQKRAHVLAVDGAKAAETKARRVEKIIEALSSGR
jgi:antitoxin component of MazEF toxin-antitoxin module